MERDTTQVPTDSQPTPADTFLQQQGTGVPADTAGYSGLEHPDSQRNGWERHDEPDGSGHLGHVRNERHDRSNQLGYDCTSSKVD